MAKLMNVQSRNRVSFNELTSQRGRIFDPYGLAALVQGSQMTAEPHCVPGYRRRYLEFVLSMLMEPSFGAKLGANVYQDLLSLLTSFWLECRLNMVYEQGMQQSNLASTVMRLAEYLQLHHRIR